METEDFAVTYKANSEDARQRRGLVVTEVDEKVAVDHVERVEAMRKHEESSAYASDEEGEAGEVDPVDPGPDGPEENEGQEGDHPGVEEIRVTESRFQRMFIGTSFMKQAYFSSRRVLHADGAFSKASINPGMLLIATVPDPNNEVRVVAFGIVSIENTANWRWFLTQLSQFLGEDPSQFHIMSDADKGLIPASKDLGTKPLGWCTKHAFESLNKCAKQTGIFSCHLKSCLSRVGRAYSLEEYERHTHDLLHLIPEARKGLVKDWLMKNGPKISDYYLYSANEDRWEANRYGCLTNNPAESTNSALVGERHENICSLVESIISREVRRYNDSFGNLAMWQTLNKEVCPNIEKSTRALASNEKKKKTPNRVMIPQDAEAVVVALPNGSLKMTCPTHVTDGNIISNRKEVVLRFIPSQPLNGGVVIPLPDTPSIECRCGYPMRWGRPCVHAAVVLDSLDLHREEYRPFKASAPCFYSTEFRVTRMAEFLRPLKGLLERQSTLPDIDQAYKFAIKTSADGNTGFLCFPPRNVKFKGRKRKTKSKDFREASQNARDKAVFKIHKKEVRGATDSVIRLE